MEKEPAKLDQKVSAFQSFDKKQKKSSRKVQTKFQNGGHNLNQ